MQHHGIHVLAIQEADLNASTVVSFLAYWKRHGYYCSVAPCQDGLARTALISTFLMHCFAFPEASARYCGGVLEFRENGQLRKLILTSFDGVAGDIPTTRALLSSVLDCVLLAAFPVIILGDYNSEIHESAVAPVLSSGRLHCMDDSRLSSPPPASPNDQRVIDFGLCAGDVFPSGALTVPGLADHKGVLYDVPLDDPTPVYAPKTCILRHRLLASLRRWPATSYMRILGLLSRLVTPLTRCGTLWPATQTRHCMAFAPPSPVSAPALGSGTL